VPIYQYIKEDDAKGCESCRDGFEIKQAISEEMLKVCPTCKGRVRKVFPHIVIGASKTGLDRRAKDSGFHKLKKVDKNKYEKLY
jgi:putative FmdB family regulatory protein